MLESPFTPICQELAAKFDEAEIANDLDRTKFQI